MTELLAANPKAKDRALARKAIEELGPSPLAEGTLRKRFGALRQAGLPPLETEEDIEERKIEEFFKAKAAARASNELELSIALQEASALSLDLSTLDREAIEQFIRDLDWEKTQIEIGLASGMFVDGVPTAAEAITKRRRWKERLGVVKGQLEVLLKIAGLRQRLSVPK